MNRVIAILGAVLFVSGLFGGNAWAADFYQGKTITIVVGAPAGGLNDLYARLFATRLAAFIPGHPSVVVQDMPGAGSVIAANYLYNAAPKDGTGLGLMLNTLALTQFTAPRQIRYDVGRFVWIGRADAPVHVLLAWAPSGIRSIEDAKRRTVLTGETAPGTASEYFPRLANAFLKTRFKLISGYDGAAGIRLALERGELAASGSDTWPSLVEAKPEWVRDKKVVALFQVTFKRDRQLLPDSPTLLELTKGDLERSVVRFITAIDAIGFSLMAPPDTPANRIAILRKAFDSMMSDPIYASNVTKFGGSVSPIAGADLQRLVQSIRATPNNVVAEFQKATSTN